MCWGPKREDQQLKNTGVLAYRQTQVGMPGSGGEVILPPQPAYPRVGYCRAGNGQHIVSLVGSGITQRPSFQTHLEGVN